MSDNLFLPILSLLLLISGPLLGRLQIWPWTTGVACSLLSLLPAFWLLLRRPLRRPKLTLLAALIPVVGFLYLAGKALYLPVENDVSTDPLNPPALTWAHSLRSADDLAINPGQLATERVMPGPLSVSALPEEVVGLAEKLMQAHGWQTIRTPTGLQAVATSFWFGFQDDIALRVQMGAKVRVDMRSASRSGRHDLGVNRTRVEKFMQELASELEKHQPKAAARLP